MKQTRFFILFAIKLACFAVLPSLLLASCMMPKHMKGQEVKTELSLREMRSDVEDFKYQLNSYEVELQMLEGKANGQESDLNELRQHIVRTGQTSKNLIEGKLTTLDSRFTAMERTEESMIADLHKLKEHANITTAALAQCKAKLDDNERIVVQQARTMESMKDAMTALIQVVDQQGSGDMSSLQLYTVKSGDSLDRLAKDHHTTVDNIKKLNQLSSDLIVVGQKLYLP